MGSGAENQHSRGGHGGVTLAAPEQASCGAEQQLDLQLQAMLESLQAGLASALRGADSLQARTMWRALQSVKIRQTRFRD